MGKPSRTRDLMGALLLVLVGLLYMTGVSELPVERGAGAGAAVEMRDASLPVAPDTEADFRI